MKTKIKSKKQKEREEIESAMSLYLSEGKIPRKMTKEQELLDLANNDYTDFTMRCGESGIIPGFERGY